MTSKTTNLADFTSTLYKVYTKDTLPLANSVQVGTFLYTEDGGENNQPSYYFSDGTSWIQMGAGAGGATEFIGPIGFTGSRGVQGDSIVGFTGSRGIQGDSGSVGYTGSAGVKGDTGDLGDVGYTGSRGATGFTGSRGEIGYTGSRGAYDAIGFTGSRGDVGYTGSRGLTGIQGIQGDVGYTGSRGEVGIQGIQGDVGYTGSRGATGFTGSRGEIGYTGSRGAYDAIGFTGSRGATGLTGPQGDVGYTGSQGAGFTGSQGYDAGVRYLFNTSTGDVNPGVGHFSFDSTALTSTTRINLNVTEITNRAITGYIDSWDDSTNPLKGHLIFRSVVNSIDVITFKLNSVNSGTSFRRLNVTYVSGSGSYPLNDEEHTIIFVPAGELGYIGSVGYTGSAGTEGVKGEIGYTGSRGAYDAIGFTGSRGATGFTGSRGEIGYVGSRGDVGFTGSRGAYDAIGFTGSRGASGVRGFTGSRGPNAGIIYDFNIDLTNANPGVGLFRFNNATIESITQIYISITDIEGISQTSFIESWDDSTNPKKGHLIISSNIASRRIIFEIDSVVSATDYRILNVTYITGSTTLFSDNEECSISFFRNGDLGYTGSVGYTGSQGVTGYVGSQGVISKTQFAQATLIGGGTVTWTGERLKWSQRVMAIPVEKTEYGSQGFFQFSMPASGTLITRYTGSSGSTTSTVDDNGILLSTFEALWGIVTIGAGAVSVEYVTTIYTNETWGPPTEGWILIAHTNQDNSRGLKWIPGNCILQAPGSTEGSADPSIFHTNYTVKYARNLPAFQATGTNLNNTVIPTNTWTLVGPSTTATTWSTSRNAGDVFDVTTALFTAPITGNYLINSSMTFYWSSTGRSVVQMKLYVNGAAIPGGTYATPDVSMGAAAFLYRQSDLSQIIKLNANDNVSVYINSNGTNAYIPLGGPYTQFSAIYIG